VIVLSRPKVGAPPPPVIRNAIRKALPESPNDHDSDDSKKPELVAVEKVSSKITKDRVERELAAKSAKNKKADGGKDVPDAAVETLLREKQNLEVRVQELVNSAENKTAEIATLRMEINRLRVRFSNFSLIS
jgi:hypothetical protein